MTIGKLSYTVWETERKINEEKWTKPKKLVAESIEVNTIQPCIV